jgi:hypothetical protein
MIVRVAGELRDALEQLSRNPDAGAVAVPGEPAENSRANPGLLERSRLQACFELGVDREQVPAQPVDRSGSLDDQLVAMVVKQADLHRLLV